MQRFFILIGATLITICGCAAPNLNPQSHIHSYSLSQEDLDFAYALSRYSAGIAEEIEHGHASSNSVDFFVEAAIHDPANYFLARKAAIGLLYRRRAHDAAELLEKTQTYNPDNYRLLLDLATVYDIGDQPEKKQQTYERAMELSPTNAAAYIAASRSQLKAGQLQEALKSLRKGVRSSDKKLMCELALINAAALLKGGFPLKSIDWFLFVAEHSKENRGKMHLIAAEIYEGRGERNNALEHYELAVRQSDAEPEAYLRMALLANKADSKSALAILDRAEQRFPMDETILSAVVYLTRDNPDRSSALKLLHKFANRSKKEPTETFYLHLGGTYEQTGNIDKAANIFEKALKSYPESDKIMNYLAYMWAVKGLHLEKGEKLTRKALQIDPDNAAYLDTLGWIFFMQGENEEALRYIQKALKHLPEDPTILEHLGDILARNGNIKDAVRHWTKSYMIDSANETLKKKLKEHDALTENNEI